jgi:hypothetical protein
MRFLTEKHLVRRDGTLLKLYFVEFNCKTRTVIVTPPCKHRKLSSTFDSLLRGRIFFVLGLSDHPTSVYIGPASFA